MIGKFVRLTRPLGLTLNVPPASPDWLGFIVATSNCGLAPAAIVFGAGLVS